MRNESYDFVQHLPSFREYRWFSFILLIEHSFQFWPVVRQSVYYLLSPFKILLESCQFPIMWRGVPQMKVITATGERQRVCVWI